MRNLAKFDLTLSIFLAFFAVIGIFASYNIGLGNFEQIGPGLFPFLACITVLFTSAGLIISSFRSLRKIINSESQNQKNQPVIWRRPIIILISLAVWPILVNLIGYIISSFIVCFGITKAIGYQGLLKPLVFCLFISLGIWLIFGIMFDVDLPPGFSF